MQITVSKVAETANLNNILQLRERIYLTNILKEKGIKFKLRDLNDKNNIITKYLRQIGAVLYEGMREKNRGEIKGSDLTKIEKLNPNEAKNRYMGFEKRGENQRFAGIF